MEKKMSLPPYFFPVSRISFRLHIGSVCMVFFKMETRYAVSMIKISDPSLLEGPEKHKNLEERLQSRLAYNLGSYFEKRARVRDAFQRPGHLGSFCGRRL